MRTGHNRGSGRTGSRARLAYDHSTPDVPASPSLGGIMSHPVSSPHRRGFLGGIAAGAAALIVGRWSGANAAILEHAENAVFADEWVGKIKGKYRQVFDCVTANDGWGAAFPLN